MSQNLFTKESVSAQDLCYATKALIMAEVTTEVNRILMVAKYPEGEKEKNFIIENNKHKSIPSVIYRDIVSDLIRNYLIGFGYMADRKVEIDGGEKPRIPRGNLEDLTKCLVIDEPTYTNLIELKLLMNSKYLY